MSVQFTVKYQWLRSSQRFQGFPGICFRFKSQEDRTHRNAPWVCRSLACTSRCVAHAAVMTQGKCRGLIKCRRLDNATSRRAGVHAEIRKSAKREYCYADVRSKVKHQHRITFVKQATQARRAGPLRRSRPSACCLRLIHLKRALP